jgi:hypothetical protein
VYHDGDPLPTTSRTRDAELQIPVTIFERDASSRSERGGADPTEAPTTRIVGWLEADLPERARKP